jgi:hypothetical protein
VDGSTTPVKESRKRKGEELCGRRSGTVENGRLVAGEHGFLAPAAPLGNAGRRYIEGDRRFEGGQVAHVADGAAMVATPVVVGMHRDGCGGLKTGKARQ